MPKSLCRPSLAYQILTLLNDHGPLTIDLLNRMTEPSAAKKNLRQSLSLLQKKGLLNRLTLDPTTTFYHISQSQKCRAQISEIIGRPVEMLVQPLLQRQDWFHNQWCEYWIHIIRSRFPTASIVREHLICGSELTRQILCIDKDESTLLPDFLLSFPKTETTREIHIAFEIERTRKTNERIIHKLRKYLNGTQIDGLIYICDSGRLAETIRTLYQARLVEKAQRAKHYGDNFFLFSDCFAAGGLLLNRLFNANGESVELENWIHKLISTKWTLRRNSDFKT